MAKSIFELICENIAGGVLGEAFSLPEKDGDAAALHFAPGAFDGMCRYHMRPEPLDGNGIGRMANALKAAAAGNAEEADVLFDAWAADCRAIQYVDDLQNYVLEHAEELDAGNVNRTALSLVLHSRSAECVKVGLALLELFGNPPDSYKEIIRNVGLCDEFTIFAVWNMLRWENGNAEIFDLAKKVHGWGRIHAVEQLEPETDEIRHWLLTEGAVNDVMAAYSALTCWEKSQADKLLAGRPSPEEFRAVSSLIEGLLDEGPVAGISALENAESLLLRYLEIAPHYELTVDDYSVISAIRQWAEAKEVPLTAVSEMGGGILRSARCAAAVESAVKEGKALDLAEETGIPFRASLLENMTRDFDGHYYNCRYLMNDETFVEPTLELFRKELPLAEMKGDPVDDPCLGEDYRQYDKLQYLLQELDDKPLTGTDLVMAGLESPVTRNRYRALAVLEAWKKRKKRPLAELAPDLCKAVSLLEFREINEGNLKMIAVLLEE